MGLSRSVERSIIAVGLIFAAMWLWGRCTAEPDWDAPPPMDVVHDRCEYISDGQPFYIGDDDRSDIDSNNNGIACEPEDMK